MGAPDLLHHLRGVGLVLTLTSAGELQVAPRSALTDAHRAAIRAGRDELVLALRAEATCAQTSRHSRHRSDGQWDDGDIACFLDRRARLLRWGWSETDAEALSERLVRREHERDDRVSCADCEHYRPGRCANHQSACLQASEVGRELAAMLQRCPGFGLAT